MDGSGAGRPRGERAKGVGQFARFAVVGGSGFVVNQAALVVMNRLLGWNGLTPDGAVAPLPVGGFNVRWYHVLLSTAFLIANLWTFTLNRRWTFKAHARAWWREYPRFLATGSIALGVGLLISTALLHPGSPVALPRHVFDGSSGLRNPLYWANVIQVMCTLPVNFIGSRYWAFRHPQA